MGFNPREGTVDTHSLVTSLAIGHCLVQLDALNLLLSNLKHLQLPKVNPEVDSFENAAPTPLEAPMSAILTPATPRLEPLLSSSLGDSPPMSALLSLDTHTPVLPVSPASPLLQVLSVCYSTSVTP